MASIAALMAEFGRQWVVSVSRRVAVTLGSSRSYSAKDHVWMDLSPTLGVVASGCFTAFCSPGSGDWSNSFVVTALQGDQFAVISQLIGQRQLSIVDKQGRGKEVAGISRYSLSFVRWNSKWIVMGKDDTLYVWRTDEKNDVRAIKLPNTKTVVCGCKFADEKGGEDTLVLLTNRRNKGRVWYLALQETFDAESVLYYTTFGVPGHPVDAVWNAATGKLFTIHRHPSSFRVYNSDTKEVVHSFIRPFVDNVVTLGTEHLCTITEDTFDVYHVSDLWKPLHSFHCPCLHKQIVSFNSGIVPSVPLSSLCSDLTASMRLTATAYVPLVLHDALSGAALATFTRN